MGVINKGGALYFATGIDNSGMQRDAEETNRIVGSITKSIRSAGMIIGTVFGAATLAQFGREIINVRGEMQMLESSFETLLGGRAKADKMIADIKSYAIESPLSLTGVSQAAQTLLGFNVAAADTIPIIKQIGDISMGNDQRFASLTLAFAQMSSTGKLMGQDLNQMINAGFNPLQEIAAKTGKSISQLKDDMSKGAVSAKIVEDAFRSATAEGGKFYGMTQKQAEGIKGLKAQIDGAVQESFNNLGKSSEGFITGTYKATLLLIENYETIGRVLMSIVATYGVYKAAVMAVTVAEKSWTIASMAQYKWLLLVEKAQKLLNMTMLKNPYVAVATAVIGLVSVVIALHDRTTIAEKAQKKLNETLEEAKDRKEALKIKGNELIDVITSETASIYQQTKAYRELIALLPQLKGKTIDEIKTMDPKDIGKMISEKSDQTEQDTIQAQYDERIKNIEGYRKTIKNLTLDGVDDATISYYREQLNIAITETKGLKSQLEEFAQIQKEAFYQENPDVKRKDLQSERVALLQKEAELIERIKGAGNNDLVSANDRFALKAIQNQIETNKAAIESVKTVTDAAIIKNKEYWKSVLDEATATRDKLGSDQAGSDEWKKLTTLINSATSQLEHYSTKLNEVKDNSNKLAPRDVGSVEGAGAGILESFISSAVIDDVATRQMGEYSEKLRESLSTINMEGVDVFDILTSDLWNKAFSDLDKMAVDDMISLIRQMELHWKKLNLDPTELKVLRDQIEKITAEIGNKNPFKGLSEAIRKFKSGDGDFKDIAKNAGDSLDQVGSMFNSVTDGLTKMGMAGDEESQKMLKGIGEMVGGAATLAKGIATGNPADIIAGSVQLLTSAIEVFDKKSREANRTIKKNQEQVEILGKAYEKLENAISKTYSTKAATLIEDEQRNLEQQKRLINDNIRAEKSKKERNRDNEAIKEWQNALKAIDVRISENKDRIQESLTGTDVMSAIDEFAQAYADAWASGESAAKKSADVVKGILRNALINYMKGELQQEVDNLMNKVASSIKNDGRIDSAEQTAIDALLSSLDYKAEQYKNAVIPYLDKNNKTDGVTGELKAQLTEGTGSQLVGLWSMSAMDTRAIKEHLEKNPMPNVAKDLYAMQNELVAINRNTRETADNTSHIEEGFKGMKEELSEIKKNTKLINSRG